jgi:hypothetical protein
MASTLRVPIDIVLGRCLTHDSVPGSKQRGNLCCRLHAAGRCRVYGSRCVIYNRAYGWTYLPGICCPAGGSSAAVNAPLLSVLTRASPGGEVWAHRGYGRLFGQALLSALGRRFGTAGAVSSGRVLVAPGCVYIYNSMHRSRMLHVATSVVWLAPPPLKHAGDPAGVVDCRSTGALKLTQYLGPVDVLQPATAEVCQEKESWLNSVF